MRAGCGRSSASTASSSQINTLGSAEERRAFRARWSRISSATSDALDADAQRRLHANPLRVLDSKNPAMQDVIEAAPRLIDDLGDAIARAFRSGAGGLARGGHRRTRSIRGWCAGSTTTICTVFEWVTDRLGAQSTVCAGGRYDGLFEQLGGKPAPACGFAMGVERAAAAARRTRRVPPRGARRRISRARARRAERYAERVAEQLRDAGLAVVLHCGGGSFKSQMKKADASGARYAVIVGDDEAGAGRSA